LALLLLLGACGGIKVVHKQKLELKQAALPLRSFAFASGLRVIVEKDTRTPLAGVFVVVGSGASSDPVGKEGLAHYVEHLAFESRPFGKETFSELFDKAGTVQRNASTNWDATTYYEIGPASALPEMLRTEAIRMVAPVSDITDSSRAVELDVVRNELRERNETGFIGDVLARMQAQLFPAGHPYARPVGGSHQTVATFVKADVDAFAKAHYRPDNMTLVLVGNLDLDKADQLLAQSLPAVLVAAPKPVKLPERLPATAPAVPAPPPHPAELVRVEATIASPELWIGWTLPRGFDRDGYLLNFLASATRRRLSRARFDDRNIVGIDVFPVAGKEASMLLCRVSLHDAAAVEGSLKGVMEEVPKIVDQFAPEGVQTYSRFSFTEMAYSRARRGALVGELLEVQDLVGRGMRRASVTHLAQDPALLSKAMHDLAELKQEKIHAYALPYLTLDRARAVLFVPSQGSAGSEAASGSATREGSSAKIAAPPKAWSDELASTSAQLATYKLPNGLSVALERRPGLPLFTASLSFGIDAEVAKDGGARAALGGDARAARRHLRRARAGGGAARRRGVSRPARQRRERQAGARAGRAAQAARGAGREAPRRRRAALGAVPQGLRRGARADDQRVGGRVDLRAHPPGPLARPRGAAQGAGRGDGGRGAAGLPALPRRAADAVDRRRGGGGAGRAEGRLEVARPRPRAADRGDTGPRCSAGHG
jgi:zinc protease